MLHHFLISMLYIVLGCLFIYFKGMSFRIVLDTSNYRMFVHGS